MGSVKPATGVAHAHLNQSILARYSRTYTGLYQDAPAWGTYPSLVADSESAVSIGPSVATAHQAHMESIPGYDTRRSINNMFFSLPFKLSKA
jgi:hypothetical protein